MINLTDFQNEVHAIAIHHGFRMSKKKILKKLREEYREFKKAKYVEPLVVHIAANIKDDGDFIEYFDSLLKGTIADEIPDIPFTLMSYTKSILHDTEDLYMVKKRYNSLRKIKKVGNTEQTCQQ